MNEQGAAFFAYRVCTNTGNVCESELSGVSDGIYCCRMECGECTALGCNDRGDGLTADGESPHLTIVVWLMSRLT